MSEDVHTTQGLGLPQCVSSQEIHGCNPGALFTSIQVRRGMVHVMSMEARAMIRRYGEAFWLALR